jgi:hypothetical protein
MLLVLELACRFIGDVIWAVEVSVLRVDPFPSQHAAHAADSSA